VAGNSIKPNISWAPPAVCLITYPRSGSNYFAEYFNQLTGTHIPRSHDIDYSRGRKIITIVRNPIDCMTSRVAMICKTENITNFFDLPDVLGKDIEDYSEFYKKIILEADIFIDYERFIESPKEVMSKTLDKLNISYQMTDYTQTLDKVKGYLISSKETFLYDSIKDHYQKQDNKSLFELYEKALSLCNI
jgi:hypothetical protein